MGRGHIFSTFLIRVSIETGWVTQEMESGHSSRVLVSPLVFLPQVMVMVFPPAFSELVCTQSWVIASEWKDTPTASATLTLLKKH